MSSEAIRERFLLELERSSAQTKRSRLFWCNKFLSYAPESLSAWDGQLFNRFRARLEKEGYAVETLRTALSIVKRVYDAARAVHEDNRTRLLGEVNPKDETAVAELLKAMSLPGPRWDVGKRYLPRAQAEEISKPAMKFEEIQQVVTAARSGKLGKPETAFFALSSVYGYRAGEIRAVRREDLDYRHGTIFVNTEKGGERREQLLAPEIIPYLRKYDWDFDFTADQMTRMFKDICKDSGVKDEYRKRWHAMRHFVETEIPAALAVDRMLTKDPRTVTMIFFRYRLGSSGYMPDRYNSTVALDADRLALAHNPVVPLWV